MRIGSKLSAALSRVTSCSPNDDASEETLLMKNVDDLTTRGMKCYERYKEFGRLEDATAAIQIYCEAISLAPEGHPDKPTMINNLALSFCGRYELLGDVADLDTAIGFLKEAVAYAQEGNPDDQALSNLGAAYSSRYDRLGRLEDLDMSINCLSRAVSSTPTVDPTWLSNLGTVHGSRFENLGNSEDLDKAIHYLTLAIALAEGDLDAPTRLDNIGYSYHQRFETTGRLEDLDMAINYACQAVSDLPKSHPHQRIWLSNLGAWYQTRFQRLGNLSDIDLAIDRLAQAVSFTPEGHTDRPGPLNNLALSYRSRFERLGQLEDLDRSIDSLTQAVSQTPDDHIDKPVFFNSLGLAYQSRFDTSEELADLHSAIHCFSQAISQTPDEYTQQAIWLHNLGRAYQDRFDRLGELEDLERAIDFSSRAVSLTPETHPIMALLLGHLSGSYEDLYTYTQCMEHLHHAVGCARRATESVVGDPSTKFAAARIWALESDLHDLPSLLEAHQQAMNLIPQIVWLGADTHRRYETVAGLDDVAIEAVIAAIRYQEYDLALVWSEQGRSIVWTQLLELRTPFDQLYEIDPILARELRQVTQDLELAESGTLSRSELSTDQAAIEQVAQQHRRLAERREQLITEARKLPGMNDLLRANSAASLFAAAKAGAVVVVVIHERGCYALVIRPNCTHTSCVALTRLTHSKISAARDVLTPAIHSQGRISRHVVYRPDAAPGVEG
ncbi:hypothetical protein FRC07_003934 [Ceratobasidium sp. 392]|nr:hypothetical protein FRC07_003934 [Ceratobasidium sp. 392]